jgi:DNA primase
MKHGGQMETNHIIQLFTLLGSKKIRHANGWVMGNCPFAKWMHEKHTDNVPSFGISETSPSIYHCFSCSSKGILKKLPAVLTFLSGENYTEISKFIQENETIEAITQKVKKVNYSYNEMGYIPYVVYEKFERYSNEFKHITIEDMELWDIRYDKDKNFILFPVFDKHKRLISIRGRSITGKQFRSYTDLSTTGIDAKTYGLWFGGHFPLIKDKDLVLVEGERDVILLKKSGIKNVWGAMGASLSEAQINTLRNVQNNLLLFFDNDAAGQATVKNIEKACKGLCNIFYIKDYFRVKDPAEAYEKKLLSKIFEISNISKL